MKNFDLIIGIDPGMGGSISYQKGKEIKCVKMPKTFKDIIVYLQYLSSICESPICAIEKVQVRPDDTHGGKIFRVQKMLKNYNELLNALQVANIPYREIAPMTWQSTLRLRKKIEDEALYSELQLAKVHPVKNAKLIIGLKAKLKTIRKARYKTTAQALFPLTRATLWNCDALLLVRFILVKLHTEPNFFQSDEVTKLGIFSPNKQ